jgi:hypothetical protein
MLERAWELKVAIRKWLAATENKYSVLQLKESDWDRVNELLEILGPMEQVTALVGATKSVTVHAVFRLYNYVFSHLEASIANWEISRKDYAKEYLEALEAARNKLAEYYSRTDGSRGKFFNLATLLDPHTKQLLYSNEDDWGRALPDEYVNEFNRYFSENYLPREVPQVAQDSEQISAAPVRPATTPIQLQGLAAIGSVKRPAVQPRRFDSLESVEYLKAPESDITADNPTGDPLRAWPALELSYPNLASMAKDILAVPASGVGVEREFNQARDLITYRRCRMKPDLIEDLMIIRHYAALNKGTLSDIVASAESLAGNAESEVIDFTETSGSTEDHDSVTDSATASQDDWDYEHMVEWTDSTEDANSSADDSDSGDN